MNIDRQAVLKGMEAEADNHGRGRIDNFESLLGFTHALIGPAMGLYYGGG